MRIDIVHPVAGRVPQIANPIRFREANLVFDRPPPLLGQHTDEVLRELGIGGPQPSDGAGHVATAPAA